MKFGERDEAIFVVIDGTELVGLSVVSGDIGPDGEVGFDVADEHFFVRLFAPADSLSGVGIGGVIAAVVVDGGDCDGGVLGDHERLSGFVAELPVEVVAGDIKESLLGAIGRGEIEAEGFASDVHMSHEGEDWDIEWCGSGEGFGVMGIFRRDTNVGFGEGDGAYDVLRGLVGEVDSEFELVLCFDAVGGVVDLEADACFRGKFAGEAGGIDMSGVSGDIGCPVSADAIHSARAWVITWFGDIDEDVMNNAAVGGLDFVAPDPAIGVMFPFDEDVLVAHHTGAFDTDGFGDLNDGIRFAELPCGGEGAWEWGVHGVAFGASMIEPVNEVLFIEAGE